MAGFQLGIQFTRQQLISADYDPIARGDVDPGDLRARYEHHVDLHHTAAVRGTLVRDRTKAWKWIWGIGLLQDELLKQPGYPRLCARYRNQYPMLPRIEFEEGSDPYPALMLPLEKTPIEPHDLINIESPAGGGCPARTI